MLDYSVVKASVIYEPLHQCKKLGTLGHTERGCHLRKRCLMCSKTVSDDHISTLKCLCRKIKFPLNGFDVFKGYGENFPPIGNENNSMPVYRNEEVNRIVTRIGILA